MAKKAQLITELYHEATVEVASSPRQWQAFLTAASKNYKCRFDEQLLIYAQRPEATAVATIEVWNQRFKRWVVKNSKGIAVFDPEGQNKNLKYYFDITDTAPGFYESRPVHIWQMEEHFEADIAEHLGNIFGETNGEALPETLIQVTKNFIDDHLPDYQSQLMGFVHDSYLGDLNEQNISSIYKTLVANSVNFSVMSRCGIDPYIFFDNESFREIINFNTPETLNAIGIATSDLSEMILREISETIRDIQREEKQPVRILAEDERADYDKDKDKDERSENHERDHLQDDERLSDPRSESRNGERAAPGPLRPHAQELLGASQASDLPEPLDQREAEQTSPGDRKDSTESTRNADDGAGQSPGRDGDTQGERPDELGRDDEQHPESSRGDHHSGADPGLEEQADEEPGILPSVREQQNVIYQAEEKSASAFSISQEDIDSVLQRGSSFADGKFRIYRQYHKHEDEKKNIAFLKTEYGTGGSTHIFPDSFSGSTSHDSKGISINRGGSYTNPDLILKWPEVDKRLRALIINDRYFTPEEKDQYAGYLESVSAPDYEIELQHKLARQRFISEKRDLPPEEKRDSLALRLSDFIKDLPGYEHDLLERSDLSGVTSDQMERHLKDPATVQQLIDFLNLVQGKTADAYSRGNAWRFKYELYELHPTRYHYQESDIIYVDSERYRIGEVGKNSVTLENPDFPLLTKTFDRDVLEEKLQEDQSNDHFKRLVTEAQNTEKLSEEKAATLADNRHNFRITDRELGVGGPKERFRNNVNAIRLLKTLEEDGRFATKEEQAILSQYVGWGGLSMAFDENNESWVNERAELSMLFDDKEYQDAMESTLTAFYTPPAVTEAMYKILERLNFTEGRILEPSCGTGHFFGMLPDAMANAELHGVEIDSISGRIATQLYQKAEINIKGFEETKYLDNYFDVAIGNVPFGDFKVDDEKYKSNGFQIHDYFFAKALDQVRPGGVVLFITSKGTMDKRSLEVRKYIAQRAELLGAIRLPNNTFKAAAGTEVTSDILILQKRERIIDIELDWVHLNQDENGITMNDYFTNHPEMIMGEMVMESGRFGMETACKAIESRPLEEQLSRAVERIDGEISTYESSEIDEISDDVVESIPADPEVRNFSYAVIDDELYFRDDDRMVPASVSVTAENRIRGLIELRDSVRRLITLQTDDAPEEDIVGEQEVLGRHYDEFTKKYGLINSRGNAMAFASDESYYLLCSLEILDDDGNFERKADMFTKRTINPHRVITHADTASDALALSIGERARVDLDFMAELTGKSKDALIHDLHGVIFREPDSEPARYVTADEYLSGNVREKLKAAEYAVLSDSQFEINVESLKQIIPKDLGPGEISVRLGATWIPPEDVQAFMIEHLEPSYYTATRIAVRYASVTGQWFIENKRLDNGNVKATSTYGTKRVSAYKIIEDTLNLKDVRVFDTIVDTEGKKQSILNHKETTAAQAKQGMIKQAFQDWIWKDPDRRNRLLRLYNDCFNAGRPREYDGSHINFVGMNPEISLRTHQVNAIAHHLYGGNTLFAHKVGAGKTFTIVAAAQEGKRLGLCEKSMITVPNHLVGQWASQYLRLYPSANILVTTKKDFETKNRKKFCARIATGDYDAVIIGHSQFEKIPMSMERQRQNLQDQLDEIEDGIADLKRQRGDTFSVKQLVKTRRSIKGKLEKLNNTKRKDNVIDFDDLGIDRLFVDESHLFKNLFLYTKMRNVGGIAQTEAQKSFDLFMKCRYLDEITGSRGIVFATGTPLSNSMVELYTIKRYLQYQGLIARGLQHFDCWASTFGETVTALELAPEGTSYRAKTRFAKFYNLPELMQMFREVADIQTADMLNLPVPKVEYHNISVKPTEIQAEMVAELANRAERVRAREVSANVDNMLLITNDGRKLALDQRIIDPMLPDDDGSKVNECVRNVRRIWKDNAASKATQLIFCDLSTPKNDGNFNIYDDMREKLVSFGIPKEEIRFIHEAKTDAAKKELFAKVRSGEVRILFGSTAKLGAGTDIQDKLIALHDLDCPWRPSDLEQRLGRIERQGNGHSVVQVYRYVTSQTFDAYLYQLVESKQKFIGQIMTSKSPVRSAEDVDEVALSFAEIKMLATGDERFKEKMELDIDVSKLRMLKQSFLSEHYDLEDRVLKHYPKRLAEAEAYMTALEKDKQTAEKHRSPDKEKISPMVLKGVTYVEKADTGKKLLEISKEIKSTTPIEVGSYGGFKMELFYDVVGKSYGLNLCGEVKHRVYLGDDIYGNITRIENELAKLPNKLEAAEERQVETKAQLENAKMELLKPFAFEEELKAKSERLEQLNIGLNLNEKEVVDAEVGMEQSDELTERKCVGWER